MAGHPWERESGLAFAFASGGICGDGWTGQFFTSGIARGGFLAIPNSNPDWVFPTWQAPAPAVTLAAPQVAVVEDTQTGALRALLLSYGGSPFFPMLEDWPGS